MQARRVALKLAHEENIQSIIRNINDSKYIERNIGDAYCEMADNIQQTD